MDDKRDDKQDNKIDMLVEGQARIEERLNQVVKSLDNHISRDWNIFYAVIVAFIGLIIYVSKVS